MPHMVISESKTALGKTKTIIHHIKGNNLLMQNDPTKTFFK